jgi:hypothetical protein
MIDIFCNGYTTVALSDENEVFLWGKSMFKNQNNQEDSIKEPTLIVKAEEGSLQASDHDENHYFDRVFALKGLGFLLISKPSNIFSLLFKPHYRN